MKELQDIARHEAGHYIAARCLGFPAAEITLELQIFNGHKAGSSVTVGQPLESLPAVVSYLRKRVQVLFAGALAESLRHGKVNQDYALKCLEEKGGTNDFAKARELINLLRNIEHHETMTPETAQAELDPLSEKAWTDTISLVEGEADNIEALASQLAKEVKAVGTKFTISADMLNGYSCLAAKLSKT
jgi:hypothetical protein